MSNPSRMKRTNFYFPNAQLRQMKKLSEKMDTSMSELIRRAVDRYIEESEKRAAA